MKTCESQKQLVHQPQIIQNTSVKQAKKGDEVNYSSDEAPQFTKIIKDSEIRLTTKPNNKSYNSIAKSELQNFNRSFSQNRNHDTSFCSESVKKSVKK